MVPLALTTTAPWAGFVTDELTGDTAAGRAIAATFGFTPRGLELSGTLLSAALRIVIVLVALPPVLGPWSLFATDALDFLRQLAAGVRVAGITISLGAVLTAFVWLVVGILAARGAQRWLETRVMPRTGIDGRCEVGTEGRAVRRATASRRGRGL